MNKSTIFLIIFNLLLIGALAYVYRISISSTSVDYTKSLITENSKTIEDLKLQFQQIDEQNKKNLEQYKSEIHAINETYEARLTALEKKRIDVSTSISNKNRGDVEGLAQEFSNVTGIKVGAKK
jgi:hypothetical protein